MEFTIAHKLPGRLRLRLRRNSLSNLESQALQTFLSNDLQVISAEVSSITGSVLIQYSTSFDNIIALMTKIKVSDLIIHETNEHENINSESFVISIAKKLVFRYILKPLLPLPVRQLLTFYNSKSYF